MITEFDINLQKFSLVKSDNNGVTKLTTAVIIILKKIALWQKIL